MRQILLTIPLLLCSLACTSGDSGKVRPLGESAAAPPPDTALNAPPPQPAPAAKKPAKRAWDTAAPESFNVEELNRRRAERPTVVPRTREDTIEMLMKIKPDEFGAFSYLKPSEYPGLPPDIAGWLEERDFVIPQVVTPVYQYFDQDWTPHNAISGEFIRLGQTDWAVYCTDGDTTVIALFHGGRIDSVEKIHGEPTHGKYASGCRDLIRVENVNLLSDQYKLRNEDCVPKPLIIDHQCISIGSYVYLGHLLYFYEGRWYIFESTDDE